jgi:IS5 family transposase
MDGVILWQPIVALIEPHYPTAGSSTQPMPLEQMLCLYIMHQRLNLSDPAMEDALFDSEAMHHFAGSGLVDHAVPDESTILRLRHLLDRHGLSPQAFGLVRGLLQQKRLLLKSATIVDAPPRTKNETKARDPEMRHGKKARGWRFGMKAHVGTDPDGLVHTLVTNDAGTPDINELPRPLRGAERVLYGD